MFLLKNQENFTKNLDYHPNFASNFHENILIPCILITKKVYYYHFTILFLSNFTTFFEYYHKYYIEY